MKQIGLLLLVFLRVFNGFSCSCYGLEEEYTNDQRTANVINKMDYIFIGIAEDWTIIDRGVEFRIEDKEFHDYGQKVKFKVVEQFKGKKVSYLDVVQKYYKSSCEMGVKKGSKYLIYGYYEKDSLGNSHLFFSGCDESDRWPNQSFKFNKQEILTLRYFSSLYYSNNSHTFNLKTRFSNGQISAIGQYKNGIPIGYWEYFTLDGKLAEYGEYVEGEKSNKWEKKNFEIKYLDYPNIKTIDLDSIQIVNITKDFFLWYINASKGIKEEYNPIMKEDVNGMTSLDFTKYFKNLRRYHFADILLIKEKTSYQTCIDNLAKIKFSDFQKMQDLDEFEQINCDFTNYYRWTGGQEMYENYTVLNVNFQNYKATVIGLLEPSKNTTVTLNREDNQWKIIDITK